MRYQIVTNKDKTPAWWSSFEGWTTRDKAEWFDDSDIEALINHFYSNGRIASAIAQNAEFLGFDLTGMARIEINDDYDVNTKLKNVFGLYY